MPKYIKLIFSFFLIVFYNSFSQTKMPSFFSNNMVLQQQDDVAIWGTDLPNSDIEIHTSWGIKKSIKTNANGEWKTSILTPKASFAEQKITIKGSSTIVLQNVLIGEVWLASGQSNMEMALRGPGKPAINGAEVLINTSINKYLRLFNTERAASLSQEDDVLGSWKESNPESVESFSAVGYLFSRALFEKLQIPIGIIEASWGGTSIFCWLPKSSTEIHPEIKVPNKLPEDKTKQARPTFLYNAMIHPFQLYSIKGFLWYQGEANRNNAKFYKNYMQTLIGSWREQWQKKDLPFYFVQIAPYDYGKRYKSKAQSFGANLVREAQTKVAQEIKNTGVVITTDVGECDEIHPPEKNIVANRLVNWALANDYNFKDLAYRSPEYKSIKIKKNKAIIGFRFFGTNNDNRILDSKMELKNFVIAGEDRIFYPAQVKMNKNKTVTVFSDKVKNPVAVRYGFEDCLEGTLFSNAGLPVSPFRTDIWE